MSETQDSIAQPTQPDPAILRKALPLANFRYDQSYSELAALAERGDSMAAYKLWLGLRACNGVPRDAESLASQENRLRETRLIDGQPANDEWIANTIEFMKKVFPFCSGVPAGSDVRALSYRWLERAADAGSIGGLLDFVSEAYLKVGPAAPEMLPRRREMLDRLESMAVKGNPVALSRLYLLYSTDRDDVPRDPVKAYAYIRASRDIMGVAMSKPQEGGGANVDLSAGELVQAEQLRKDILHAAQTNFLATSENAQ